MRNIAIINTCDFGSTGKIAKGLKQYFLDNNEKVLFCYGRGNKTSDENEFLIERKSEVYCHAALSRITGYQGAYSRNATKKLIEVLRNRKTNILYLVSLHGYYLNEKMLWDYVAEDGVKVIYLMIDEYAYLGKCGYADGCENYLSGCGQCPQIRNYPKSLFIDRSRSIFSMKKDAYRKVSDITFVGPKYTIEMAKKSPLTADERTEVVDEAINCVFYYPRDTSVLLRELNIENADEKIIAVCIAPYSNERKGAKYFIEAARALEEDDKYVFVQVGVDVRLTNIPSNYVPIGYVRDQEKLAQYYSLGDVFVFPSLLDTMPNTCLEALACGTPLLGFNVSGMPYIADETVSSLVEPKNVQALVDSIVNTPKKDEQISNRCREYALKRYDSREYFRKLASLL